MRQDRHDTARRDERLQHAARTCLTQGLPFTAQRRRVYEAVLDLATHPTADEVFALAAKRQPGLGRATVYRSLEAFVRVGVLARVVHHGAAIRYDACVHRHHHLVCRTCGTILDVEDERLDDVPVPDVTATGFEVDDVQVQLLGSCQACRKKKQRDRDKEGS